MSPPATLLMAAVIGVPDPRWGEAGCAFVTPHPDKQANDEELLAWCKRHLATFQCPTRILIAESLPKGHSGKIDKRALAALARETVDK